MKKFAQLLMVFVLALPTLSLAAQQITDPELYYPPPYEKEVYVVKAGDTLGGIAKKVYGDLNKWKELCKLNPQIENPNLIIVGQQIVVRAVPIVRDREEYRKQIRSALIRAIFKIRRMAYAEEEILKKEFTLVYLSLAKYTGYGLTFAMDDSTFIAKEQAWRMVQILERLSVYELVDAIMKVTKDDPWDDAPYLLAAIAWQESHFYNRRGKKGERSCFQILPSTARLLDRTIEWQICLDRIERHPDYAAKLAWGFLQDCRQQYKSYRKGLAYYNGSSTYADNVIKKFHILRRMG